ncbi:MAG: tRNA (adenosine(37)-N6)-dimethylallyltransferase MiaA [candidate division Zixibacteria bacterium]|nr:tRNA (adenosine(37)-N6)-dimethylallyltransferase MiaA [candidate division Zixibacteria bacterium]
MIASLGAAEARPIPIICGPTASGKTSVALELASHAPIEIVSADSRQLVRHLDIGTAKPTAAERARVPFHLIDIIEPGERYSAFRFINDATRVIKEILKRGHQPMLVGGTGLYLRALTDGVVEIEQGDMLIRQELERQMDELGPEALHARLKEIDPLEASKIHPNNRVRVMRALEIFHLTGKSKSEVTATGSYRKSDFQFEYHCILPERAKLYQRINERVDEMLQLGWVAETEGMAAQGMADQVRLANIIGYNELLNYIEGLISLEEAVSSIKQSTRRYAKRQVTWFTRQGNCKYYSAAQEVITVLGRR